MDILAVWEMVAKYMDVISVVIAFTFTQLIKYLLPTPEEFRGKWTTKVTPFANRLLPIIPVIIGSIAAIVHSKFDGSFVNWGNAALHGIISGMAAAYLYNTIKVSFFGTVSVKPSELEKHNPEDCKPKPGEIVIEDVK